MVADAAVASVASAASVASVASAASAALAALADDAYDDAVAVWDAAASAHVIVGRVVRELVVAATLCPWPCDAQSAAPVAALANDDAAADHRRFDAALAVAVVVAVVAAFAVGVRAPNADSDALDRPVRPDSTLDRLRDN